jgi:hypothetical protein
MKTQVDVKTEKKDRSCRSSSVLFARTVLAKDIELQHGARQGKATLVSAATSAWFGGREAYSYGTETAPTRKNSRETA